MNYLDNAATSFPKPDAVYRAVDEFQRTSLGNPGRSGHRLAAASERVVALARQRINRFLHGAGPERVVFTLNGTDALNIAIKGVLRPGDHVVTGVLEHNSVRRPLEALAESGGVEISLVDCDDEGYYHPSDIADAIRPNTRLVAITGASNVLGTVQPFGQIGPLCRERDVLLLVDAAQTLGCVPLDVERAGIDLLAAPGHKSMFAPAGIGLLYVGPRAVVRSFREGGTGRDSGERRHPTSMPEALEAGTPNVPGIVGLLAGLEFLEDKGIPAITRHEMELSRQMIESLTRIPGIELLPTGKWDRRVPLVSFRIEGMSSQEVASLLDASFGIAVRAGLHCSPETHRRFGTFPEGAVRASASFLTQPWQIDEFASAVRQISKVAIP